MEDIFTVVQAQLDAAKLPPEAAITLAKARQSVRQSDTQPTAVQRVAMLGQDQGLGHVLLFKDFQSSPRAVQDLLDVYGEYILLGAGHVGQEIWTRKLALADPSAADTFNEKLRSRKYSTFRSLVESYAGAVERLVALHFANAFIHHRMAFADAFNIDIKEWPHTAGLANQTVPYSLVPLISAYADPDVWRNFPVAFRHRVSGTLACSRKDVKEEFVKVIDAVCESRDS